MFSWRRGRTKISNALSTVELLVHMDCEGCEKKVRRAISKLDGVDTTEIDVENQKVTVTGYVDQGQVLELMRRTGRKAEFWPFPHGGQYYPYASTFVSAYGYYMHGWYFPDSTVDDQTFHLFSDDNAHAYCTIM